MQSLVLGVEMELKMSQLPTLARIEGSKLAREIVDAMETEA